MDSIKYIDEVKDDITIMAVKEEEKMNGEIIIKKTSQEQAQ